MLKILVVVFLFLSGPIVASESCLAGRHKTTADDPRIDMRYNRSKNFWEKRINGFWVRADCDTRSHREVACVEPRRVVRELEPPPRLIREAPRAEEICFDYQAEIEEYIQRLGGCKYICWNLICKQERNNSKRNVIFGSPKSSVYYEFMLNPKSVPGRKQVKSVRLEIGEGGKQFNIVIETY